MNRPNPQAMFLRSMEAHIFIEDEPDPAIKIILEMAQYQALKSFMGPSDKSLSDEEFLEQLPAAPFDMLFYLKAVKNFLTYKHMLTQVLSGDIDAADQVW